MINNFRLRLIFKGLERDKNIRLVYHSQSLIIFIVYGADAIRYRRIIEIG